MLNVQACWGGRVGSRPTVGRKSMIKSRSKSAFRWNASRAKPTSGHLKREHKLAGFFAEEESAMWGSTAFCYGHTDHLHSNSELIDPDGGMLATRHPTLAARDAHAARGGWHSHRNVSSVTYPQECGKWGGVTVIPPKPAITTV